MTYQRMTCASSAAARHGYTFYHQSCFLLLLTANLIILTTAARMSTETTQIFSQKMREKEMIVEGSGTFENGRLKEDSEWQASGSNPDDEPGDDFDDDDNGNEGSGDMVQGSGSPAQSNKHDLSIQNMITSSSLATTTLISIERPLDVMSEIQTTARSVPSSILSTTTTSSTYTPTTSHFTTSTRSIIAVMNTQRPTFVSSKPPLEPEPPYISEIEQPFEMLKPGILAAVSGGAVVGVLMTILLVMFIIYRMRKKDEGSYSLDEPHHHPPNYSYAYQKASTKEFYA